ncbi:MAG: hypothetical protein BWY74_02790 [Firmicutes bacterium ADurb.Bin419]|jgi:hypothetical protein|nr:MAG: hypothetical protein BWY74_02790 [Firmicutes bacterium ADurb.Bin419]
MLLLEFPNLIDIWKDVVDLSVKIVRRECNDKNSNY